MQIAQNAWEGVMDEKKTAYCDIEFCPEYAGEGKVTLIFKQGCGDATQDLLILEMSIDEIKLLSELLVVAQGTKSDNVKFEMTMVKVSNVHPAAAPHLIRGM